MRSRVGAVVTLTFCLGLAGCGADLLWWPGFNPIINSYVATIPVSSVATEVQCEIYDFLQAENADKDHPSILDPSKGATVSLVLQEDLTGSVQYVGINLSQLGLTSLGELVTATNKTPSLQAKGSIHDTVSAEVDFVVAQSGTPQTDLASKPPGPMLIKKSDIGAYYQNASFKQVSSSAAVFQAEPQPSTKIPHPYFPTAHCQLQNPVERTYLWLWLKDWLMGFKNSEQRYPPFVCNTKATLKSSFEIAVDVSAGVNAFIAPPIILPVSGFNVDGNPDFMHTIQISFALYDPNKKHAAYCSGLEGAQPAQINR